MKNTKYTLIALFVFLTLFLTSALAQNAPTPPAPPQADAKDVDSVEHIVAAVYDCISGPAGLRNWDRFRSLFYPGARMIPSFRDAKGSIAARSNTVDEYAERAGAYFAKEGFYESALANRVEVWDHIAHVWSTYESRHAKGEKPFARGINSFQLMYDGNRWWIVTIYWASEEAAHPIPEKYLK
jgi:hypothetical protein